MVTSITLFNLQQNNQQQVILLYIYQTPNVFFGLYSLTDCLQGGVFFGAEIFHKWYFSVYQSDGLFKRHLPEISANSFLLLKSENVKTIAQKIVLTSLGQESTG